MKLTDNLVRTLKAPESGNKIYYDSDVRGLGLRITQAGSRAWVFNYRTDGRERRITIADAGTKPLMNVQGARKEAIRLREKIGAGTDPLGEREAVRKAETLAELAERYLEHAAGRKRPRSLAEDKALLERVILPELGRHKVADLKRADVEELFRKVSRGKHRDDSALTPRPAPVRANRMLSLLRRIMNLAADWELREAPNPVVRIERNAETKRERYLDQEELGRLMAAIAACRNQQTANVIRLALLTGARRGELLQATWEQFDLAAGTWHKPASTTKQKRTHIIPLNGPALELLGRMKAESGSGWLFPGDDGKPQGDLKRTWASVCKSAELADLRFHDIRHAFASFLASSGHNLPLIGQLLGHSSPATTARYAHLLKEAQLEASERVGAIVKRASGESVSAEVLPMTKHKR